MINKHHLKSTTKALSEYALMPQNKALKARIYAKDFIQTLDERFSACIEVAFVKNAELILRAKSVVAFAELKHKNVVDELDLALQKYAQSKPQSEFAGLRVRVEAPFNVFKKDARTKNGLVKIAVDEKPLFERSRGEFHNHFEPQGELFESFERLRKSIKKHIELLKLSELQGEWA